MPKTYSTDVKIRAVALAEATSLEDASRKLGIPKETIARWVDEAPDQSALERAHDLAMSELTAKMAAGERAGIRDLAVVAGIMRDKIARYGKARPASGPTPFDVLNEWEGWVCDYLVDDEIPTDEAAFDEYADAFSEAIGWLHAELLGRANAEPGQPHRGDLLAWHYRGYAEGRVSTDFLTTEQKARLVDPARSDDLMDWCVAQSLEAVTPHGGLMSWYRHQLDLQEQEREITRRADTIRNTTGIPMHQALELARNPPELDPDTLAVLARAERYLQENP